MKAVATYYDRINGVLEASAKVIEARTKKDIKVTASNLALQSHSRLVDVVYDDSPYYEAYLKEAK
jgi:hypothetical protein